MPNYVEQATLEVIDRSSGPVKTINAELRKLAATANALKGALAGTRIDAGLVKAATQTAKLRSELSALTKVRAAPKVDVASINAAIVQANKLRAALSGITGGRAGVGAGITAAPSVGTQAAARAAIAEMARAKRTAEREAASVDAARWAAGRRILAEAAREQKRAAAEAATIDAARWATGRRIMAEAAREQKRAATEAASVDAARWATGRRIMAEAAREQKRAATEAATIDAARWATGRRIMAEAAREQKRAAAEAATIDAARWATGRRIMAEAAREQKQAASELAREQRRADSALRQRLTNFRETNPTILRLQADQREAARQARAASRYDARPVPGTVSPLIDSVGVGTRIGNAFASTARSIAHEIGRSIAYGFARGAIEGSKDAVKSEETARARLSLLALTPQQNAAAQSIAADTAKQVPGITRGEALGLTAEVIPGVLGDMEAARTLTLRLAELAAVQQALGASAKEANDKALLVFKAFAQTGQVFDQHGKIDLPATQKAFEDYNRAVVQVGREVNPQSFFTLEKNLGAAKYGLNDAGLIGALIVQESLGAAKTGTGYNQLVKQLAGFGATKQIITNLAAAGLINFEEIKTGRVGKQQRTSIVGKGSRFADELASDPAKFVRERVIPIAIANGVDINDAAQVTQFARTITSDRTATNILIELIQNAAEIKAQTDAARGRKLDPKKAVEDSLVLAANDLKAKAFTAGADIVEAFRSPLIAAAHGLSAVVQAVTDYVRPEGQTSAARTASAAVGVAGLVTAGAYAGRSALNFLNPLFPAATALTGSAGALTAAAGAITAAARGGALPAVAGAAGGSAVPAPAGSTLGLVAKRAAAGGAAGLAVGAVEFALADDKVMGAAQLFGSAAGGALGAVVGGPVGATIGMTIGQSAAAALVSSGVGAKLAAGVAEAVQSVKAAVTGEKPLSPYDAHAQETVNAARADVAKVRAEIAAIEARRKGGNLSPEDQTTRDNLGFKLKGAEERLSTYTRGAIDAVASVGNAASARISDDAAAATAAIKAAAEADAATAVIKAAAEADAARKREIPPPKPTPAEGPTPPPKPTPAEGPTPPPKPTPVVQATQAEKDAMAYRAAVAGTKTAAERAEAVRAVAAGIAARNAARDAEIAAREAAKNADKATGTSKEMSPKPIGASATASQFIAPSKEPIFVGTPAAASAVAAETAATSARGLVELPSNFDASFASGSAALDAAFSTGASAIESAGSNVTASWDAAFQSGAAAVAAAITSALSAGVNVNVLGGAAPSGPAAPAPTGTTRPN